MFIYFYYSKVNPISLNADFYIYFKRCRWILKAKFYSARQIWQRWTRSLARSDGINRFHHHHRRRDLISPVKIRSLFSCAFSLCNSLTHTPMSPITLFIHTHEQRRHQTTGSLFTSGVGFLIGALFRDFYFLGFYHQLASFIRISFLF